MRLLGNGEKKFTWLPRALRYFVANKNYGMIDRIANATNANVALTVLYDAMRTLESVISSGKEDEFVRAFAGDRVEKKGNKSYYCFESSNCPSVCEKEGEKCCCDARALFSLASKEVEALKYEILNKFSVETMKKLKVIALNALG